MTARTSSRFRWAICTGVLLAAIGRLPVEPAAGQEPRTNSTDLETQLREQSRQIQELQEQLTQQQARLQAFSDATALLPPDDPNGMQDEVPSDSRLDLLEERVFGLQAEAQSFLDNPPESNRSVNGRIHLDGWTFPNSSQGCDLIETGDPEKPPQSRVLFRRLRFGVAGEIPPDNMSYRVELEFSQEDGSLFRDAWIGWDDLEVAQTLRLGNQKRPYGFDELNSSNFMIFMERPFIDEAVNTNNRRFGAMAYGDSDNQAVNWRLGVFDLRLIQSTAQIVDDNVQPEVAWRFANTWWYDECCGGRNYGHWALSGTFAFPDGLAPNVDDETNEAIFQSRPEARTNETWLDTGRITGAGSYQLLGIESVVNYGALQVGGEAMNVWVQRLDGFGPDLYFSGAYLYLSYFLTGEHLSWNRAMGVLGRVKPFEDFGFQRSYRSGARRGLGALQAAARLSYADFNDEDIFGGRGQALTLALNWYWNDHARLQLNYLFGSIDDRQAELGTGGSEIVSGHYQIFGIRTMADF